MINPQQKLEDAIYSDFPKGIAVVIGGSGGIGQAVCRRLAECGCDVALTYRSNAAAGAKSASIIEAFDRKAFIAPLDLVDAAATKAFLDDVAVSYGKIHTLVVATGADFKMKYLADVDVEEWRRTITNDLVGFFNVIKFAIPHLREGEGGSIVALSSAAMARHSPMDILSTGPKGGIDAIVRGVAREEGKFNIRANSVGLGVINAGLMDRIWDQITPEFAAVMRTGNSLRRIGTAEEAANAIVFLASPRSSFITGQRLMVDGGWSS